MTQLFTNNADSALTAAIGAAATTCTVADGSRFAAPTGGDYQLVTINTGSTYEVCRLTGRTGNVLTITRAQEGTTAQSWGIGARVFADVTAAAMGRSVVPDGRISVGTLPPDSGYPVGTDGINIQTYRGIPPALASGARSIAIGSAEASGADSLGIGNQVVSEAEQSLAIGYYSHASAMGAGALQSGAALHNFVFNMANLPAALPASWAWGNADAFRADGTMEAVVLSAPIDMKATGTITLPVLAGGVRFYADEVGLIVQSANTVTVQPEISVGITGDNAKLLAAVTTTGLDAANKRQRFQTLLSHDGETAYTVTVVTAATATTLTARAYFRGFAIQDDQA